MIRRAWKPQSLHRARLAKACAFTVLVLSLSGTWVAAQGPGAPLDPPVLDLSKGEAADPTLPATSNWQPPAATPSLTQAMVGPEASSGWMRSMPGGENDEAWTWQVLPNGIPYRSYLAGMKEPRLASMWVKEKDFGWMWDIALGGRAGILRFGSESPDRANGWQLDIEGAGFPRLDMEHERDVISTDYRAGFPISYTYGPYQTRFGYYHLSSHLGDEFMLRYPQLTRINYSRDVLIWGHSYYLTDDLRAYFEAGWAFNSDGGSEPWEFQFGMEYSPIRPWTGCRGAPFAAVNAHLRQDVDYGGSIVFQTGWQWRGAYGNLFRVGLQYFNGKSEQYEFFRQSEEKVGFGVWYDF
jgi:hypothetical protein